MDLNNFFSKYNRVIDILNYICEKRQFFASEIENKFKINHATLYRYLDRWREDGLIIRQKLAHIQKNGSRYIYTVTPKCDLFFINFRSEVLNKLLTKSSSLDIDFRSIFFRNYLN